MVPGLTDNGVGYPISQHKATIISCMNFSQVCFHRHKMNFEQGTQLTQNQINLYGKQRFSNSSFLFVEENVEHFDKRCKLQN